MIIGLCLESYIPVKLRDIHRIKTAAMQLLNFFYLFFFRLEEPNNNNNSTDNTNWSSRYPKRKYYKETERKSYVCLYVCYVYVSIVMPSKPWNERDREIK